MTPYHPWRELRARPHLTLHFAIGGPARLLGCIRHDGIIELADGQLQAARRCTICHELVHDERRIYPLDPVLRAREERTVERIAARRLIPLAQLADVLRWAHCIDEAAAELWVDVPMLQARLDALSPAERALLQAVADAA